jgi:tetratricopeptide (TPR) repeat protein
MEAKALNSIGIVYHNQKNYDKALEYYFKALELAKDIEYTYGVSKGLNNVAAIYGIWEEYPKVLRYLRESIDLNLKAGNLEMLGVNYLNLGYYFQELNHYDSALFYYQEALSLSNIQDNSASVISAKIFLAEYYLEIGDLTKAKQFAYESLEDSRSNGLKRFVYETANLLSKIYFKQNDSIQAYRYEILELRMKDSLNIEESQTEMSKLELQYKLEKAEQKKRIAQQRKDMVTIIVVTSLIFVIIVIILLLSRMRIKSRTVKLENDKLELDLEIRSKELTANVMSIMKKNKSLWQIAKKLKTIQKEAVKDETKMAIRKITRELNKAVEDEHWEEFELRFNQTHSEFYTKLLDRFPNLTPHEQRLCAFLRLNMTTKEISEITGQRTATIEMARTRLRKKLNITNTQTNLITFLTQI